MQQHHPAPTGVPHMRPDEFRRRAAQVVDMIASYLEGGADDLPVRSSRAPGETASMLPASAPEQGEDWDEILRDIGRIVLPGLTHWQSRRFFGYFPCACSYPGILGDLLCTGLMVQGMLWQTSPACTEIESRVMDWLGRAVGLPGAMLHDDSAGAGGGVIQGTASEAALVAMAAARHRIGARTSDPARLRVYTSTQAHSSIAKNARILGLPDESVRLIETDDHLAMRADALDEAMARDERDGLVPMFCCATLGTTSTGAVDPLGAIGPVCRARGAWLHVDAAYTGAALVCPEFRWAIEGVEHADSFNFNPHKWLLTNFDCSALWTRDVASITGAMSITPEYLRNDPTDSGAVIDYRDWQVPLGRRFRALKLWFVMRHYGLEGLRAHIRHQVALAQTFENLVESDQRFELCARRRFALVCFRLKGDDGPNRRLVSRLNDSGELFLTHSVVPVRGEDRYVVRFSVNAPSTTGADIRRAWETITRCAGDAGG